MLIVKDSYRRKQKQRRAKFMHNYISEMGLGEYAINWRKKNTTDNINGEMSRMCQCKLIFFHGFCGDWCDLSTHIAPGGVAVILEL